MSNAKPESWGVRNTKRLFALLRAPGQFKHLRRYIESREQNYMLDKPSPWLTFDAIDYLVARLSPDWRIFEYGSGGSTLFWLRAGAEVVSVEHDAEWHRVMQERLVQGQRIDYRLVLPEHGNICPPSFDVADPHCYFSNDPQYASMNFKNYASQIDEYPDHHFDMVLVDGRARPSCLIHSVNKMKIGGLLVLDNADRYYYLQDVRSSLHGFTEHRFRGLGPGNPIYLQTQTNIFVKHT